jgi:hypothetical protein
VVFVCRLKTISIKRHSKHMSTRGVRRDRLSGGSSGVPGKVNTLIPRAMVVASASLGSLRTECSLHRIKRNQAPHVEGQE